jgi:hypothetical protein
MGVLGVEVSHLICAVFAVVLFGICASSDEELDLEVVLLENGLDGI